MAKELIKSFGKWADGGMSLSDGKRRKIICRIFAPSLLNEKAVSVWAEEKTEDHIYSKIMKI